MLEALIRPFQDPGSTATQRFVVPSSNKQPPQIAQLIWGAAGTMPTAVASLVTGGIGATIDSSILTGDTQNTEKKGTRVVVQKRIENPDDPSQFVMVEDTRSITFTAKQKTAAAATLIVNPASGIVESPTTSTTVSGSGAPKADDAMNNVSFSFDDT